MTVDDISMISYYRKLGFGYKKISSLTGLSSNTVKAYMQRHPDDGQACLFCGSPLPKTDYKRSRKFCSDKCRSSWWNSHPRMVNRNLHTHTCEQCGSRFSSHYKTQKFCSRTCFGASRRKAVRDHG